MQAHSSELSPSFGLHPKLWASFNVKGAVEFLDRVLSAGLGDCEE